MGRWFFGSLLAALGIAFALASIMIMSEGYDLSPEASMYHIRSVQTVTATLLGYHRIVYCGQEPMMSFGMCDFLSPQAVPFKGELSSLVGAFFAAHFGFFCEWVLAALMIYVGIRMAKAGSSDADRRYDDDESAAS